MANVKLTALTAITGADTAAADIFVLDDVSIPETKKITRDEMRVAISDANDFLTHTRVTANLDSFASHANTNAASLAAGIAGLSIDLSVGADSGSDDTVTVGTDTLNFAGGTGLTSTVSDNQIEFKIDDTAVTAGLYGGVVGTETQVPVLTIDAQGRITGASNAAVSVDLATLEGNVNTVSDNVELVRGNLDAFATGANSNAAALAAGITNSGTDFNPQINTVQDNVVSAEANIVLNTSNLDSFASTSNSNATSLAAGIVTAAKAQFQSDNGTIFDVNRTNGEKLNLEGGSGIETAGDSGGKKVTFNLSTVGNSGKYGGVDGTTLQIPQLVFDAFGRQISVANVSYPADFSSVDANVDTVQDNVTALTSNVDIVQDNVAQNTANINVVQDNVTANFNQLDANINVVQDNVTANFNQLDANINVVQDNVTANFNQLDANISVVQDNVTANFNQLNANISVVQDNVAANFTQLDSNINVVQDNVAAIIDGTTAFTGDVTFEDTTDDSAAGPEFNLFRNSATPADGDYLGQVKFQGKSDSGTTRIYSKMTGKISSVTNGSETGLIEVAVRDSGSNKITTRFKGDEIQTLNDVGLNIDGTSTFADQVTINDDLIVAGNLTINGDQTTINTTNMEVDDTLIMLANGTTGAPANDIGILFNRGNQGNAAFFYDESAQTFKISDTLDPSSNTSLSPVTASNLDVGILTAATIKFDGADLNTAITDNVALLDTRANAFDTYTQLNSNINVVSSNSAAVEARRVANIAGAISTVVTSDLTASRALESDSSGKISASAVTTTELGYVNVTELGLVEASKALVANTDGEITFPDDKKLYFGSDQDYSIDFDTTYTGLFLRGPATGEVRVNTNQFQVYNAAETQVMFRADAGSITNLYYNGTLVFQVGASNVLIQGGSDFGVQNNVQFGTNTSNTVEVTGEITTNSLNATVLKKGGTTITSTAAELNYNDGVTLGTSQASKVVTADADGDVTLSADAVINGNVTIGTNDSNTISLTGVLDLGALS